MLMFTAEAMLFIGISCLMICVGILLMGGEFSFKLSFGEIYFKVKKDVKNEKSERIAAVAFRKRK